jgi:hypothetical protein
MERALHTEQFPEGDGAGEVRGARSNSPLPLGEGGRRPGEGAADVATEDTITPASTLTPALSGRERGR